MSTTNKFSTPDNTVGNLNGFFKEVYAEKLHELIPEALKLVNLIKFVSKDKQGGNLYHQPVILGMEHGVTFASSDDDAFNLNPAVAGVIKDAQVRGNPMVMRSLLGYVAASRSAGGKNAFMDATKYLVANMLRSMSKKLEIHLLYGQKGYGAIDTGGVSGAAITIATAEWAPGIWAGAEGMPIEIVDAAGSTSRGEFTIASVNMDTRVITLTTSAGAAGAVATDVIYHKGAFGNEFAGIHKILENTGTLFNINAGTYNLWKGNSYAVAGALSFAKLSKAISRAVEKGLDSKVTVFVNPRGWSDLLQDQASLRQYDQSYSPVQLEQGSKSLKFFSQNGDMEIVPSIYVKEGYAYALCMEEWMRIGSSDITFKRPGQGADEFFRDLENSAAYELRLYTDQCVFCMSPGKNVLLTGVINVA
jgi:hypothetical protein